MHLYLDGSDSVNYFIWSSEQGLYTKSGSISLEDLSDKEQQVKFVGKILAGEGGAADSIGFVFYLANEFSLAAIGPDHKLKSNFAELVEELTVSPAEVLEDKSMVADERALCLFPYQGATGGNDQSTVVVLSREYEGIVDNFREIADEKDFPIVVAAVSAPLCALLALPVIWASRDDRGVVVVYNYRTFSMLAYFDANGELCTLRTLQHHEGSQCPKDIGRTVQMTAVAMELEDPDVHIISMADHDVTDVILNIGSAMYASEIREVTFAELQQRGGLQEGVFVEAALVNKVYDPSVYPIVENKTFTDLLESKYHLQDFLVPPSDMQEVYPVHGEIKLMQMVKKIRLAVFALAAVIAIYFSLSAVSTMAKPEWGHKAMNHAAAQIKINQQINAYKKWDNLLTDRSKAWEVLELVSRTFTDGGVELTNVTYDCTVKEKSSRSVGTDDEGLHKTYSITGNADANVIDKLIKYDTRDGGEMFFGELFESTQIASFKPAETREFGIAFQYRSANSRGGDDLPYSFTLQITQKYSKDDPLALLSSN